MIIPFPAFSPDRAAYSTDATDVALNVIPIADGWGPMASFVPYADALPSAPRGSITARNSSGTQVTIIGTATALYRVESDGSLTDVSGPSAPYSVPDDDEWSFDLYGDRIVAANITDDIQYYDISTSTDFADLPGSPPKARFVKVIGDFLAVYQLADDKSAIAWSGINNSEQWVPGEELSDTNSFPDGGELQAISVNGSGAILAFREGFRTMTFSPDSGYVFTFSPLAEGNGCSSPLSLVEIGRGDFVYYSDTGFYRGASATPIGAERVDRWITEVAPESARGKIKGVADPFRKIVLWRYEDAGGNGYLLGYSWQLDRWFQSDTPVSGLGVFATPSLTLEDLDALYPAGLDSIPFSLDSSAFSGGRPSFSGFDASYRLGFFTGLSQAVTIETGANEFSPGTRAFVNDVRAITDAENHSMLIGMYYDHGYDPDWTIEVAPNPRSKLMNFRADARLHKFRFKIPSGENWTTATAINTNPIATGAL